MNFNEIFEKNVTYDIKRLKVTAKQSFTLSTDSIIFEIYYG